MTWKRTIAPAIALTVLNACTPPPKAQPLTPEESEYVDLQIDEIEAGQSLINSILNLAVPLCSVSGEPLYNDNQVLQSELYDVLSDIRMMHDEGRILKMPRCDLHQSSDALAKAYGARTSDTSLDDYMLLASADECGGEGIFDTPGDLAVVGAGVLPHERVHYRFGGHKVSFGALDVRDDRMEVAIQTDVCDSPTIVGLLWDAEMALHLFSSNVSEIESACEDITNQVGDGYNYESPQWAYEALLNLRETVRTEFIAELDESIYKSWTDNHWNTSALTVLSEIGLNEASIEVLVDSHSELLEPRYRVVDQAIETLLSDHENDIEE